MTSSISADLFPTRSPAEWERAGNGSEIQFFATDEDLLEILSEVSRTTSTICFLIIETDGEQAHLVECPLLELRTCLARGNNEVVLKSATRAVASDPGPLFLEMQAWILSGFVLLQHGFLWHGRQSATRFARLNQARNLRTREVENNVPGKTTFDALRRVVRKRAVWTSIRLLADGTPDEDDHLALMTAGAAAAAREYPDRWEATPGRRVRNE
jgi:hypothetical protein